MRFSLLASFTLLIIFVASVAAEPIYLYDVNVTTNETWQFGQPQEILVHPLNLTGGLIDVTNIKITIIDDVNFSKTTMSRIDTGVYTQTYTINRTNITSMSFNVTVMEKEKYVTKTFTVNFEDDGVFQKIWGTTKDYWKNTKEMFLKNIDNYWIMGGIALFLVLTLVLFLDMIFRRKKE